VHGNINRNSTSSAFVEQHNAFAIPPDDWLVRYVEQLLSQPTSSTPPLFLDCLPRDSLQSEVRTYESVEVRDHRTQLPLQIGRCYGERTRSPQP